PSIRHRMVMLETRPSGNRATSSFENKNATVMLGSKLNGRIVIQSAHWRGKSHEPIVLVE
ncbi:MAG: hypothetical protein QM636_07345, partial [Rhizobium sp.]